MNLDRYDTPEAESLIAIGKERPTRALEHRREVTTQALAAAGFMLAATLLAALAPWHGPLIAWRVALAIATYVAVERVRFPVGGGATYPTVLAFVPMLFLLPTPVVPLVAAASILVGGIPRYVRRRAPLSRVPSDVADAWYSLGPALVLVLAGAGYFAWSHWAMYVLALFAQIAFDMAATVARCSIGEGIKPRVQVPCLTWIYVTDAALWPVGLLIAGAAVHRPGLTLLALSPAALLLVFAREREQRLDQTLALSTAYRGTALLLGDVVEADDHYTGTHSRDVVDLSLAVADALGLDPDVRQQIEFAALLHDVGKIRVPKEILNKHGKLSPAEAAVLRRHTIDGEQMLKQVGGTLSSVGRIVRASHERYDGAGYPDGLVADQIPVEARIIAVCDAYSAMTTDRPYRAALPLSESLRELERCAGTQFDPAVVDALVAIVTASSSAALERDGLDRAAPPNNATLRSSPKRNTPMSLTRASSRPESEGVLVALTPGSPSTTAQRPPSGLSGQELFASFAADPAG
jgi:HD-GYP domain-containing protein (c-di-GMP phosphodiesterase class II)